MVMSGTYLDKALFFFFALFVFSSTFSIALSQMSLGAALIIFVIACIREKYNPFIKELKWFYIFTLLYLFWMMVASLVGPHPVVSLHKLYEDWLFCIIFIAIYLFRDEKKREWILRVFLVAVVLVALYAVLQHFTKVHWFKSYDLNQVAPGVVRVAGNFSHPLTFANYFAVVAMFFLGLAMGRERLVPLWERLLFLGVSGLCLLAIVYSFSRGALGAAFVCIIAFGVVFKRKYLIPVIIVVILIFVAVVFVPGMQERFTHQIKKDFDVHNEEGRAFIWYNSVQMIRDNPVFGISPNEFGEEYKRRVREDIYPWYLYSHAHNDFLHVTVVSGIPGLLFFAGMWLCVLWLLWKTYRIKGLSPPERDLMVAVFLGTIVFLITSMIEATFMDEEVRALLMFLWGAGFSVLYNNRKKLASNPA